MLRKVGVYYMVMEVSYEDGYSHGSILIPKAMDNLDI